MATPSGHPDYGGSGIRRRQSTAHSEHDNSTAMGTSDDQRERSPASSKDDAASAHSAGNTHSTGMDSSQSSGFDSAPRVRFSSDIERQSQPPSSGPIHEPPPPSAGSTHSALRSRPGTADLSLDTGSATTKSPVQGANLVRSPPPVTSSTSPRNAVSPTSPTSRGRGYSLRSALFRRNIPETVTSPVIELQETASASAQPVKERPKSIETARKSDADTSVTITPVVESSSSDTSKVTKGLQGISALPHYESWILSRARRNGFVRAAKAAYEKSRKIILRIQEIPPSKDGRHIDLDASRKKDLIDERTGKLYVTNTIRSTRYTAWNFLPRQLFAQFSKLANFYFLCVSILQMIPGLSTTGSFTTFAPLMFFVSISMAKEGIDDLRRHKLDKTENNRDAKVLHAYRPTKAGSPDTTATEVPEVAPIHWAPTKWHDVKVGDVVKLDRNDAAPADLVLLRSSGANGIAYVETMALDGETNLKSKQATASLSRVCTTEEKVAACRAHFVVEDPNLDLYNFEGRVTVNGETSPLTNNEIVYRGSILRNTPDAIGMVIYSGEECKIRMNANKNPRIKAPSLQSIVNRIVILIVIFVIALAIFNTVAYKIWDSQEDKSWYLTNAGVAFFPILTSFIIMFNTMIPLSLYVSLEIIKLAQMYFFNDIDMYDPVSDTPCEARTSTINEELGQISYIFSDKTGTLTDNSMKFRKLSVAGTAWLHDADIRGEDNGLQLLHKKRNKGKKPARKSHASDRKHSYHHGLDGQHDEERQTTPDAPTPGPRRSSTWKSSARPEKAQHEMLTADMLRYIQRKPFTVFARKARLFLLGIALCHTCLPEVQEDGEIDFQASSPDELALVRAAQELGFLVINRDVSTITLKILPAGSDGEPILEAYEVLDVVEFSSKRKRMSVVVRFPDQRICLFCKGADSVVTQRLKQAALANRKVAEIERRVSKRKSLEAHYAMARKESEQVERKSSIGRPSMSLSRRSTGLGRPSLGGVGRPSAGGLHSMRNELDSWLKEREREVDMPAFEDASFYSQLPSAQTGRQSLAASFAASEARSSMQLEDMDDLVDESLVMDEPVVIERCFQHINDFATEGLRTLLYGYRFMDEQEYEGWKKVYLDATTSLVNRQNLIEQAGDLIEQNLELAGATAIEDKLQKGVPEAIDKIRRANIKMWMLTGDKRETAINIGHSCRLIKDYSSITVLDHEAGQVEQNIAAAILAINDAQVAHSVVVVDGQTLAMIDRDHSLQSLFFDLAVLADSVVCCRASPSQKAALVKAIRKKVKKSITLAIGDGANDIAMIQEAHVGIGITGKEGLQAARASDYSIAQFRFLTKLLLVHGRWNYIRTCKYTVGTFWKEMLFYLTQALYQRCAGYTGTSLYEPWSLSMFNTLFTSLPVIFMGIFEKDLAASTLLAVPELYTKGQRNGGFNYSIYFGWMFMAASECMIVFWSMFGLFGSIMFTRDNSLFAMGDLTFTSIVIIVSTKMQLIEMHNKSITAAISIILSVGGWFMWNILLALIYTDNKIYKVRDAFFERFGRDALWWLSLIVIVVAVASLELAVGAGRVAVEAFFSIGDVDTHTFQALEKDPVCKRRFEEAAATELQQGWDHGRKKSSLELRREEEEERRQLEEQERREGEVREMLRNRPDSEDWARRANDGAGAGGEEEGAQRKEAQPRRSLEIQEMLRRGFGSVRKDSWKGA